MFALVGELLGVHCAYCASVECPASRPGENLTRTGPFCLFGQLNLLLQLDRFALGEQRCESEQVFVPPRPPPTYLSNPSPRCKVTMDPSDSCSPEWQSDRVSIRSVRDQAVKDALMSPSSSVTPDQPLRYRRMEGSSYSVRFEVRSTGSAQNAEMMINRSRHMLE